MSSMQSSVSQHQEETGESSGEPCSVVIAYEDTPARNRALSVCAYLEKTFGAEIVFEFSWWKFVFLRDAIIAEHAANRLAAADLFLVSAHAGAELPPEVKQWLDASLSRRQGLEGMLIALVGAGTGQERGMTPLHNYLRSLAYLAKMDFLPRIVEPPSESLPGSIREVEDRAGQITRVLDRILHRTSRWNDL